MQLGGSERPTLRSYGVDGADGPARTPRWGDHSIALFILWRRGAARLPHMH
jgi:hypothetical protein